MRLSDQISTFPDDEHDAVIDANRRADEAQAKVERLQLQLDLTIRERGEAEERYGHAVNVNIETNNALKAAITLIAHLAGEID